MSERELATQPVVRERLWDDLVERWDRGARFAGLLGDGDAEHGLRMYGLLATQSELTVVDVRLSPGAARYPALTPRIPPAFWYERTLHDLYGVVPQGHPRLDPLILPRRNDNGDLGALPCPGAADHPRRVDPDERALPSHVMGRGVFSIPHGPVRSGILESVEYVVETPGEDIPHVNVRPHFKHRGIEVRFEGMPAQRAVALAERVEGIASVAHACAYCHALESAAGAHVPVTARLLRVVHAELERIANHLDVAARLADAAGLAVATARFGVHKETTLRLISALCGNRFGRGVVVPGGVAALPALGLAECRDRVRRLGRAVSGDAEALMLTASFLDRLRGTGPLTPQYAHVRGLLGPIGRASGAGDDVRWQRPYDGYPDLTRRPGPRYDDGDAMARLRVRWDEIRESLDLIGQAIELLRNGFDDELRVPVETVAGLWPGWAEAPQGEVVYVVRVAEDGRVLRCAPRSASFHNLSAFGHTFQGDILTDFPFIEASFGLSIAGVVM